MKIKEFDKWKDFEESFTKIPLSPENLAYETFNNLTSETNENLKKNTLYENSHLYKKLIDIKKLIPLFDKPLLIVPLIDNFHKIFEEQYNTLYNIYLTRIDINKNFKNNVNKQKYHKYLYYINNFIYLKLYKDLNLIYIFLNTFMKTNEITRSMNSFPIGVKSIQNTINFRNTKPDNQNVRLNPNKGIVNNTAQGILIPKKNTAQLNLKIQNCSKKIQKSINNAIINIPNNVNQKSNIKVKVNPNLTINELNEAVDKCSQKLETNIKKFIKDLNSSNVKTGGTDSPNNTLNGGFLVEIKNLEIEPKQYNQKLKDIKKAYEDGLKDNIKGFKELCKILKAYIENKNKIVTDFINDIRRKKQQNNV